MDQLEVHQGNRDKTSMPCVACGIELKTATPEACERCSNIYPPSLLKACMDQFDYVCKLTTGDVIYFTHAKIHGDHCTLDGLAAAANFSHAKSNLPHMFPRGLDVRISEIVWCADAPAGS
ncbi:MAG: hypothetical protein K2X03_21190 [Bryobacteraceae bacterium]|nr:hypothetical protein [Bryobacteraceae bacterium]